LLWLAIKKKIEPNTVIKFGIGFLFLAAAFMCSTILGFCRCGRFNLFKCFYFGVFSDYLGELSLSPIGLSIMTNRQKIIWDDDGNVVLASAYGQYAAGLLEQGCHHRMKRLR
jgi:POT family proton-dependent oligopeptide transporter